MSAARFSDPVFIVILIAWVMTVVLHEFAHGLVASWGGDYTIRERGGLSLNPLQYINPVTSIILPLVFLAMGGIPLPGGATFIRRDLIRSKLWNTAVSLAGPAANLIVFLACAVALHPRVGWVDWAPTEPGTGVAHWTNNQVFVGALLVLQGMAILLNLVPVPPLDGYQALAPYLPLRWREKVETGPTSTYLFLGFFAVLLVFPQLTQRMFMTVFHSLEALGYKPRQALAVLEAFQQGLFGR